MYQMNIDRKESFHVASGGNIEMKFHKITNFSLYLFDYYFKT